jgi:hypothetical protein
MEPESIELDEEEASGLENHALRHAKQRIWPQGARLESQ